MGKKQLCGYNQPLQAQLEIFREIISQNQVIYETLHRAQTFGLESYYIGAGCLTQTVWNYLSGNPLTYGIKDIDFVYFDNTDLSYESEDRTIQQAKRLFADLPIKVDVKNQARVHLWYKDHFGYDIKPYSSLEDAINTWPTTATALGVRHEKAGKWIVYAPYGLNDLFGMIVRANKQKITRDIYERKVRDWHSKWPNLSIVSWDD